MRSRDGGRERKREGRKGDIKKNCDMLYAGTNSDNVLIKMKLGKDALFGCPQAK